MKRPLISVVAIIPSDRKVVMIKRAKAPFAGKWSLPGGHLELGERLEGAVVREVEEESGLKVKVERLIGFENFIGQDNEKLYHYLIFCFECVAISGSLNAGEEVSEIRIVDPKNLNQETISLAVKNFLKREKYL